MYATNYARIGGFGYTFGDTEEDCGADEHLEGDTCVADVPEPGNVADKATGPGAMYPSGGGGGGGGGSAASPSSGGTTQKAAMMTGVWPWVIGGGALLAVVYFAGKKKR